MKYFIYLFLISSLCFGIMPPKYYEKMVYKSQIKAEALILHVKVTNKTEYKIKKEITFQLLKSDGKVTPQNQFKGWCYSATDKHFVGGEKYYYPKVGERVYVTLATKGGKVTSLKTMHVDIQKEIMSAIATIVTKSEEEGLKELKKLIKKDPKEFKNSYHRLYLDPNKSKYTSVLKQGYNRFVDLMVFKELAKQGLIDKYMQDSAITYIFFSSYKNFANKHLPFMELFRDLMLQNLKNNTKENQELLALFETNYLLSRGRDDEAYRILENNTPYHSKALQALSYFSSIKDIPIFSDREKLLKIINIKKFRLKEAQFEHKPKFLFDFDGKKYMMKDFQW
ncbi:hypothetical protein ACKGJI_11310 [Sulfurospirillum sp. 1307]